MPYRKVHRALTRAGFRVVRQRGSHVLYRSADGRTTVVPNHPGRDIPPGLVAKILADTGLTADDLDA